MYIKGIDKNEAEKVMQEKRRGSFQNQFNKIIKEFVYSDFEMAEIKDHGYSSPSNLQIYITSVLKKMGLSNIKAITSQKRVYLIKVKD